MLRVNSKKMKNDVYIAKSEFSYCKGSFPCPRCKEKFSELSDLLVHLRLTHSNPLRCHFCGVRAANGYDFLSHCWADHMNVRPAGDSQECRINFHDKQVSNTKQTRQSFNKVGVHSYRGLKCPHCEKRFMSEDVLFQHVWKHKDPMTCKECGKISKNMNNFCSHWRMHTKEKPWVCPCGRAFSIKYSLKKHLTQCMDVSRGTLQRCQTNIIQYLDTRPIKKRRITTSTEKLSDVCQREVPRP